MPEQAIMSVT